jgi:hypothetical protein
LIFESPLNPAAYEVLAALATAFLELLDLPQWLQDILAVFHEFGRHLSDRRAYLFLPSRNGMRVRPIPLAARCSRTRFAHAFGGALWKAFRGLATFDQAC